jgi:hypothetical protein
MTCTTRATTTLPRPAPTWFASLALLVASPPSPQDEAPQLWAGLTPGSHDVGFRVLEERDHARAFGSFDRATGATAEVEHRPVQISLWYPAARTDASERLRFGELVVAASRETDFSPSTPATEARWTSSYGGSSPLFEGADPSALTELMQAPMAAVRGATAAPGPFPLLLAVGSADLQPSHFEFLASHGFVIASVPSVGPLGPRRGAPGLADYEACARDLEFALGRMHDIPFANTERVALIGFGGGGLFALPVLLRNAHIDAFVSYEAGIFMPAFAPVVERVPGFDLDRFDAPLLHFLRDELVVDEDPERMEAAPEGRSHFVYLNAPGLHHHDLAQAGVASTEVLGLRQDLRDDVRAAFRVKALHTLSFLQAYLLGDRSALERLEDAPDAEGLDAEDFTVLCL